MGYSKRGEITDFEPDNTPTKLYIQAGEWNTLAEIVERVESHFKEICEQKGVSLDDLLMYGEHIHTRCIYYDRYDPGDYDDYVVFELIEKKST